MIAALPDGAGAAGKLVMSASKPPLDELNNSAYPSLGWNNDDVQVIRHDCKGK